ncbi:MAG: aspartate aminotransferase family protein [Bacteroidales bacterium]|nr:aspartate aminotransferase family protein [Bacteroidales bacterium]
MKLFDVYSRFDIELVKAGGVYVYGSDGTQYLDLYGGHGVISIGHTHPHYVQKLTEQLQKLAFYSNSVQLPIQEAFAMQLGKISGYPDYNLFLCNSGAEANENALKLASFQTGKKKVVAFKKSFHGRTSAAVSVTDAPKLSAPLNKDGFEVEFLELNDKKAMQNALSGKDVCAVIVEGIQGVGGLDMPSESFLKTLSELTKQHDVLLILDEIQSGYGRSGKFFAHQYAGIRPDLITVAKGMGNGFPVAGVLISPEINNEYGMLGTTFGGNPLACAAGLAVLDVMEQEDIIENVNKVSAYLKSALLNIAPIKKIKGKGLMLGIELGFPVQELRKKLLLEHHILTGSSTNPNLMRILPPLNISEEQITIFHEALMRVLSEK